MALETVTKPYRAELCWGWKTDDLDVLKTVMFTDAAVTRDSDTKAIVAHIPLPPRDGTQDELVAHFGDNAGNLLVQLTAERSAATTAATKATTDLQAAAAAKDNALGDQKATYEGQIADLKAQLDAMTKQFTDLQSVCGLTDGGAALLAQQQNAAIKQQAQDALSKLPPEDQQAVIIAIQAVSVDPIPLPPTPEPVTTDVQAVQ